MLLVYLPDSQPPTALAAAHKVVKQIKEWGESIFCPVCGSDNIFFARKSDSGKRWMEIAAACGDCPNRFPVPERILQGLWRNNNKAPTETFGPLYSDIPEPEEVCA
jgi:hypothetical protein